MHKIRKTDKRHAQNKEGPYRFFLCGISHEGNTLPERKRQQIDSRARPIEKSHVSQMGRPQGRDLTVGNSPAFTEGKLFAEPPSPGKKRTLNNGVCCSERRNHKTLKGGHRSFRETRTQGGYPRKTLPRTTLKDKWFKYSLDR